MNSKPQHDLVIRNGNVVDGTGAPSRRADVAITGEFITEVGEVAGRGREEIDADGNYVTPGFIDIHTHYDGQVTWDDRVWPSTLHGATTALMSNCGLGFAPCREADQDSLIRLMEGVEDLPGTILSEGLKWEWETFPEYLDALDARALDVDLCVMVPHAPLRVYVMGARALALEDATEAEIAEMARLVEEGVRAGAWGFSTSRSTTHKTVDGNYTPTLRARQDEISGLLAGVRAGGRDFFEFVIDMWDPDVAQELEMLHGCIGETGVRAAFAVTQNHTQPEEWRRLIAMSDEAIANGINCRPQVPPRGIGVMMALESSEHPFSGTATFRRLAPLPHEEKVREMRRPEVRAAMLADDPTEYATFRNYNNMPFTNMYRLGDPPNYAPEQEDSLEHIAEVEGSTPREVAYDILLENDGTGMIYAPSSNFYKGSLEAAEEMLSNPNTLMGLGDGGAHVGYILDASFPTFLLTYWVRDKGRFTIENAIHRVTGDPASMLGLQDRGVIAPGLRADLNIINLERLEGELPYVSTDLPLGGKRFLQRVTGYEYTILRGRTTYRDGIPTDEMPGRLVRSS